jgi:hypothetical protein
MNKILVLDYDETLCSSMYAHNEKHADELFDTYSYYWKGVKYELPNDGWYISFIRSWAIELVQYFQTTLGLDNVCILSWGTNDYVLKSVESLGINISPTNIFTREDMGANVPRFKNKNVVLVDNEPWTYHRSGPVNKVFFLHGLQPEKMVNVGPFDVRYFRDESDITLDNLIKDIESAFDHGISL